MIGGMVKSKTFWTGVAGLLYGVAGYVSGYLDGQQAMQIVQTSLIAIFLRHAIEKQSA
jgi:hypothetical protein